MMRSFYSGISGLKNHVTKLDVIGNNIANVNTVGFKASTVLFQDVYSQTVRSGSAGNVDGIGGTNPSQIGLGVKLASISVSHTSAATQSTERAYDLAIEGDGFFIVADYSTGTATYKYTRVGSFELDNNGYLVTKDGYYVMGYVREEELDATTGDPTGKFIIDTSDPNNLEKICLKYPAPNPAYDPSDPASTEPEFLEDADGNIIYKDYLGFGVDYDGVVSVTINEVGTPMAIIALALFSNPTGLEKGGDSMYRQTAASGSPQFTTPRSDGAGKINGGGLEMSNVDLATEFTEMIVAQRGYQANSRIITVADSMLEELVNLKR